MLFEVNCCENWDQMTKTPSKSPPASGDSANSARTGPEKLGRRTAPLEASQGTQSPQNDLDTKAATDKGEPKKRPTPDAWDREAKRLIKGAMVVHGYNYKSLAAALSKPHDTVSETTLTLRINRASFNFGFALRVLRAMGVKKIDIEHIKQHKSPPMPSPKPPAKVEK